MSVLRTFAFAGAVLGVAGPWMAVASPSALAERGKIVDGVHVAPSAGALVPLLRPEGVDTVRVRVPPAEPGAVVTFVLPSVPPGSGPVTYRYLPGPRVRAVGIPANEPVEWAAERGPLALAFALPRTITVGTFDAGTVIGQRAGAAPWVVRLEGSVLERLRLEAALATISTVNVPGGEATVRYTIRNRGNTLDTVLVDIRPDPAWKPRQTPGRVPVAPGDSAVGEVLLGIPETASPGASSVVQVVATGRGGDSQTASASVMISGAAAVTAKWTRLTTDIFVGGAAHSRSGASGTRPALVVRSTGLVAQATHLDVQLRQGAPYTSVPVFQRFLYAPEVLVALRAPTWNAAAGDITAIGPRMGGLLLGRGVLGAARVRGVEARGFFARGVHAAAGDLDGGGESSRGHAAHGSVQTERFGARVGLMGTDVDRRAGLLGSGVRTRSALGTLDLVGARQSLSVEAGWLEVEAAPIPGILGVLGAFAGPGADTVRLDTARLSAAGMGLDALYAFYGRAGSVNARLRRIPATAAGADLRGNEAVLSGRFRVLRSTEVFATGALTSDPRIGENHPFRTRSAQAGARVASAGRYADLSVVASKSEQTEPLERRVDRTSVQAGAGLTGTFLGASVSVEAGQETLEGADVLTDSLASGGSRPFLSVQGSTRYQSPGAYLALTAARRHYAFGGSPTTVDLYGGIVRQRFEIEGGANVTAGVGLPLTQGIGARLGASYELVRGTSLAGGVDVRPGIGSGTQVTLGVRRRIGVPVPIPAPTALAGTVFHDLNGDGQRQAGEPALPGVVVGLGYLRSTSSAGGRYAFPADLAGAELVVDASTLPDSLRVPSGRMLRMAGVRRLDLPATQSARLSLRLRLDRNRNGTLDSDDPPATDAYVTVLDPADRRRDAEPDTAGRIELDGLLPGAYRLEVAGAMVGDRRPAPRVDSVSLAPGERAERTLLVRDASRQVRFGPRGAPQSAPAAQSSSPPVQPQSPGVLPAAPPGAPVATACLQVRFRTGSSSAANMEALARRALACLPPAPEPICLVGRTDDVGSMTFNDLLARRRAISVREALVRAGIPRRRFRIEARGERGLARLPVEARAANRVVEIGLRGGCVSGE